jgi:hypothetical protein
MMAKVTIVVSARLSQDDRIAHTGQSVVPVGVEGLDVEQADAFSTLTVRTLSFSITHGVSKSTE